MIVKTEITKVLKDGQLQVRETIEIVEDGIVKKVYHRRVVSPGDDVTTQDKVIKDKVQELHTPEVIEKFKEEKEKNKD